MLICDFDYVSTCYITGNVHNYSDEVIDKVYTIDALTVVYGTDGKIDLDATQATFAAGEGFPKGVKVAEVGENSITIEDSKGFELTIDVNPSPVEDANGNIVDYNDVSFTALQLDITGIGAMDTQIGANEGQILEIRIPEISLQRLGITNTDVTTQDNSKDAINTVKHAILYVSDARSRLGAYQNRLEHTISNLDVTNENMTSSYSRIMDVDMAEEMTTYTTQQVVAQAATSMLAQANERPSQVLQLLQ